jgi:predicted metal-dependent hydrolase
VNATATIHIDRLIRSRRRTIALEIAFDGRLIVRSPASTPAELINRFIAEKSAWIKTKQEEAREKHLHAVPKQFIPGETHLFLGSAYRLTIVEGAETPLILDGEFLLSGAHTHHPQQVFVNWYKKAAHKKLGERLEFYSVLSGLAYCSYRITDARKRWGSCGSDGKLTFAWRLIMAPTHVIDYVVVHELAHIAEHNHSRRFWSRVESICPEYRHSRRWLKENGHTLTV